MPFLSPAINSPEEPCVRGGAEAAAGDLGILAGSYSRLSGAPLLGTQWS